jgi:prepilin-type N-terminal cleavage/methylation domain-containing protein
MKSNYRIRRGFTLVELLVVIVIIAALAGLTAPMVIRQRKKADQTEAVSNSRQIGLCLFEFETEYGNFPDDDTAQVVASNTEITVSTGNDANAKFRQLIRAGIAQSETMFYAKAVYTKKPDNSFNNDSKALENGEVGFSLMMKSGGKGLSAAGNPSRPICATPFTQQLSGEFDYDMYDGKAVILKLDNSVTSLNIVKSSGAVRMNGKSLTQDGENTVWGAQNQVEWAYPKSK